MKKLFVSAVAAVALMGLALPASALEHKLSGTWRTRMFTQADFADGADETSIVDTRTRLFYTATLSENVKLVTGFEMDAVWGDKEYGDIGADGKVVEIKRLHADINYEKWNFKVGTQGGEIGRGFLFSDDFSGLVATYDGGQFSVPLMWIKPTESGKKSNNEKDTDYFVVAPKVKLSDTFNLNPYLFYANSADSKRYSDQYGLNLPATTKQMDMFYLGVDGDMELGMGNAWFTAIYQYGTYEKRTATDKDVDVSNFLFAVGGDVKVDPFSVHGQMFYAGGDKDASKSFTAPKGASYYWAEIMGAGMFDDQSAYSNGGTFGDYISNIMAFNVGASMSPMPKLTVTGDLWYAKLNDVPKGAKDDLGTELDLMASYKLMDNLNLDVVMAYLFAGDATGKDDPYEMGAQISLKF